MIMINLFCMFSSFHFSPPFLHFRPSSSAFFKTKSVETRILKQSVQALEMTRTFPKAVCFQEFLCCSHLARSQLTIHQKMSPFQGQVLCFPELAGMNTLIIKPLLPKVQRKNKREKGINVWETLFENLFFFPYLVNPLYSFLKRLSLERKKKICSSYKKVQCHTDYMTWQCQPSEDLRNLCYIPWMRTLHHISFVA